MLHSPIIIFKYFLNFIFYLSVIAFIVSFFQKNMLPDNNEILNDMLQEPKQTKADLQEFEIEKNGITYIINPLYKYDLHGMIISEHLSSEWFDYYHDKWEDFINLKDICVIWGDNIKSESYKYFDFESGSWTCYARSKPGVEQEKWSEFKFNQLSNNHLLSNNEEINKKILSAEKGDQIYMKGYLAEYSIKDGAFERGTSATRNDNGNGACETVFLTDFEVIKRANPLWRDIYFVSKYLIAASFLILSFMYFKDI